MCVCVCVCVCARARSRSFVRACVVALSKPTLARIKNCGPLCLGIIYHEAGMRNTV